MERVKIDLTKYLENTALIHYSSAETSDLIKYKDLLKQILKVGLIVEEENLLNTESVAIGILCKKNPSAVTLALAAIEADFAFCFITKDDLTPDELKKLGIKYIFSDESLYNENTIALRKSFDIFGKKIRLYSANVNDIKTYNDVNDPMNQICYVITTSGSTGQRKIVRVTFNCITPNVISLQNIFRLHKDVIYSSAPCTFDVFILDLFLTLHSGSALLIIDENLRFSDTSINYIFGDESTSATFMQITPSLFQQFGIKNIQDKILHKNSKLRYLVLGGEAFPPTTEVSTWQNWKDPERKRIFNIYGTTEMSCWATIHEVTEEDLTFGDVPLGSDLQDTVIGFLPDLSNNLGLEEVVLTTLKRICFVDDSDSSKQRDKECRFAQLTGDLVKHSNGKVFFYGRKNENIKRFGERVNLNKIEVAASDVTSALACIYMRKKIILFVQTEDDEILKAVEKILMEKLKKSEIPDEFRKIAFLPLSVNGKICKHQLKQIYKDLLREDREMRIELEDSFLEAINQILNLKIEKNVFSSNDSDEPDGKRMKTELDLTFKALGGSSFDALRISMKLEDQTGLSNGLLPQLLGDRQSIRNICDYLRNLKTKTFHEVVKSSNHHSSKIVTKIIQRFNLEKCVDASPAIFTTTSGTFLSVGSHSHQLITINVEKLKLQSRVFLTDRIESKVTFADDYGIVGCYDGQIYSYDFMTGAINWKFHSMGMIKSKALLIDDLIIFGNYNYEKNLWCLKRSNNTKIELVWNKLVGSRGILATPLALNNSSILICTLDGTCELLNVNQGNLLWTRKFDSPIFSSPQIIPGRKEILIAEVSKRVHCIDFDGNDLWTFDADGHIFSSFAFHNEQEIETKILFGCHDKKLRCLTYQHQNKSVAITWSVELQSQIYGSPRKLEINNEIFIVSCTTNGFINFINLSNGDIEHSFKLPGEIFSTPVIHDKTLFVGCRDNFLYCITF
ncbi:CLUMA_CG014304, isoform A [Clunio marinus]|uniref:CLUMA_CG014304, isoform A n=1 Tax=Clunio marinus TaxID=568069 RepID=A0A1J1IP37_9DIPT|nr:CLUMA_CG014304, isoform A [Clunio marinus]